MVLVKLEGNKKKLITLLEKGEKPIFEICDYFKKLPKKDGGGISRPAVSKMIHSLNPVGLILFRDNEHEEKLAVLSKDKLITKYISDKFLPHIVLTGIALIISIFMGLFVSKWISLTAGIFAVPVFIYYSYQIFRTANMKNYFYERKEEEKSQILSVN